MSESVTTSTSSMTDTDTTRKRRKPVSDDKPAVVAHTRTITGFGSKSTTKEDIDEEDSAHLKELRRMVRASRKMPPLDKSSHPTTTDNKHSAAVPPPSSKKAPFGDSPSFGFDVSGFRDPIKSEFKTKTVTDHRTASKAMPVYDSDEEEKIKAKLKKAVKEDDDDAVNSLTAQLKASGIAKGISIGSKSGKGKQTDLDQFDDPTDGSLAARSLLDTMQANIPRIADKTPYSVKRFYEEYDPSTQRTIMLPSGTYDTTPKIKGTPYIPLSVAKAGKEKGTGAVEESAHFIATKLAKEYNSIIYSATPTVFAESNGKLKMSETLSILFDVFKVWAPLQHENEWDTMIEKKVGDIHRYVFNAPYRENASDKGTKMGRFVSISILPAASVAVGKFDKLFGSTTTSAKTCAAHRASLFKVYALRDKLIEFTRTRVERHQTDSEIKDAVKRERDNHYPLIYKAARLKQLLKYSQNRAVNLQTEIPALFNEIWNDPSVTSVEQTLDEYTLVSVMAVPSSNPVPSNPNPYAAAQPLPSPVLPTRR